MFFFFNWRLISLQYCVGFCHISTWISHRYMYVPSLLNLPHTDGTDEQGSNGDAEIENRFVDTWGEGEGGKNWEGNIETYIIPYVKLYSQCKFAVWCRELKSSAVWQTKGVGWMWGGREVQEGGYIHIPMTDSCWYMAETNTIL